MSVRFRYASESDHVRYPLGSDTRIEGGRRSDGDRHAIIVDRGSCTLYETFATRKRSGHWYAGSGAVWWLTSNALRPDGWTSADAAGPPDPARAAAVERGAQPRRRPRHPLHDRRHLAATTSGRRGTTPARAEPAYPPMGARFRLRARTPPRFGATPRGLVHTMKTYGLVLADNGSPWFFQGEQNSHWPSRLIGDLKRIPADRFVAVDTSSLKVSGDSGATP